MTATVLRRSRDGQGAEDFPQQFSELLAFSGDGFPDRPPATLGDCYAERRRVPPIWLLGSSGYSAKAAGEMGLGYAFASHFSPTDPAPAMHAYRESFEPSEDFYVPAILAVSVICAETNEHAEELASSMQLAWVRMRSGTPRPLP